MTLTSRTAAPYQGGSGAAVPTALTIVVYGNPGPQGSKDFKGFNGAGRAIMVESSAKVKPWREDVRAAALAVTVDCRHDTLTALSQHWQCDECGTVISGEGRTVSQPTPYDCPLLVRMVFTLRKPVSAPKRRRTWPDRYPDVSKLARSTEDALTGIVWKDDARVVEYERLAKVFPGEDPEALDRPGALVRIRPIAPPP
jgi:Holliday junction resolvase RusA-like endonuclease